ncbi:hypothetical protein BOTBODRAFT_30003 [Botryobasidium botryosum FD-172 SS1]|uniref:Uncharacterized protein n=1 Tax=Botryobasidium botryosum (strain FD-172 SS1) TaxID=930990 RepID=A0A067MN50_BOTB1|nr:hypothetical protein BOTBODRAFT_30003 [Botryobasidium botryosum FD-172 SS1]
MPEGKVNECLLYVNGHKEAARSLTTPLVHIDGIRLVLGRGMWDHKRDHAWDDQIEDVKVFQQALSEAEITDEAKKSNEPKASAAFKSAGGFMAF